MSKASIVCAFNARYTPGFLVLVESLHASPRLQSLDRIIITTDPAVRDDPAVRARATRIRFVAKEELAAFQVMRRDQIRRKHQTELLPKYSMLKWFGFDDYGYDLALYLDVDLINVTNADGILDLLDGADFVGAPLFPPELREVDGRRLKKRKTNANIRRFCNGRGDWARQLNSGVLVFNRNFMTHGVLEKLIGTGSQVSMRNEQMVLRHWLERQETIKYRLISPYFNFNAASFKHCLPDAWPRHLKRIKFLHFVGGVNPWDLSPGRITWYQQMWRDIERGVCRELPGEPA